MNILCIIDIVHVVALENAKETTHELSRVRSLELKREKNDVRKVHICLKGKNEDLACPSSEFDHIMPIYIVYTENF